MGPVRHGSTRTTAAVRRAIPQSQERRAKLAKRDDGTPQTVATWKQRAHVHAAPMGPNPGHSTVWTREAEALIVTCRRHTRRPLDDCLDARHATRPHLTRSARQRCLPRHGISR